MIELWLASTLAAGLLGHLVWVAAAPRQRLSRLGATLPACSLVAWAIFLAFGEPFAPFSPPPSALAGGSIELWTDGPVMVAGRAMGTFGSINFADRVLTLAAGPAVSYSWLVVLLAFGMDAEASVGHSHLVAVMSSILAGAFWLAVGNGVAAAHARRAARGGADRR